MTRRMRYGWFGAGCVLLLALTLGGDYRTPRLLGAGGAAVCGLLWLFARRTAELSGKPPRWAPAALFLAAFLLRVVLMAANEGYSIDATCFAGWSEQMREAGPARFYTSGIFADYPPGYLYLLWGAGLLNHLFGFDPRSPQGLFVIGLPVLVCDLLLARMLWRLAKKRGEWFALGVCALAAFAPVLLWNIGVWKQTDSVLAAALAGCFLLLQERRWAASALLYAAALLLKPQALIFGPPFAAGFLLEAVRAPRGARLKAVWQAAGCAALCLVAVWLVSLPFSAGQEPLWLPKLYLGAAGGYPYASINAYNLFALLGGNWADQTEGWLLGWRQWGLLLLLAATAALLLLAWRAAKRGVLNLPLLAGFYGLAVFTLAHNMHERYSIPALLLLLTAYAMLGGRELLRCVAAQSFVSFWNVSMTLLSLNDSAVLWLPEYDAALRLCAAMQVAVFLLACRVCWKLCSGEAAKAPAAQKAGKEAGKRPGAAASPPPAPLPWTRRDALFLCVPTLLSAVFGFWNLGATDAPRTAWTGGAVQVELAEAPSRLWVYCGLGEGTLTLRDASGVPAAEAELGGGSEPFFNWAAVPVESGSSAFTLSARDGVTVYELAFADAEGRTLPARTDAGGGPLFDEQSLRPERPGYLNGMYFDEVYHGRTAFEYLHGISPYETTHPPLGKDLIAVGIALFGMTPFGWRFMPALFGALLVPLGYLLGRLLAGKREWGLFAACLFALDFMRAGLGRIATVDVFSAFLILAAFYFLLRWQRMNPFDTSLGRQFSALIPCGAAFGLAAAVKWTGLYAGAGLAAAFFLTLRRAAGGRTPREVLPRYTRLCMGCVGCFVLLPLALYAASYLPYYLRGVTLGEVVRMQGEMFRYHSLLTAEHPFSSPWWSWPLMKRPVWAWMGTMPPEGMAEGIAFFGNPALCWGGFAAIVIAVVKKLNGPEPRPAPKGRGKALAAGGRDGDGTLLLCGFFALWLPWALISRAAFLYHYFGSELFSILMLTALCARARKGRVIAAGVGIAAALCFGFFFPAFCGLAIPAGWAAATQWFPTWLFYSL